MTNQFTDEQIEAAVKAVANEHAERGDACGPAGFARVARAALEAAETAQRKFHPFGPVAMRRGFTESER